MQDRRKFLQSSLAFTGIFLGACSDNATDSSTIVEQTTSGSGGGTSNPQSNSSTVSDNGGTGGSIQTSSSESTSSQGGGGQTGTGGNTSEGGAGGSGGQLNTGGNSSEGGANAGGNGQGGGTQSVCAATPEDPSVITYVDGAPYKTNLAPDNSGGIPLSISGKVTNESCTPITNAVLDLWQANPQGGDNAYDYSSDYLYRGKIAVDTNGNFEILTVFPGYEYFNNKPLPLHIHVKVTADGYADLITILRFSNDPVVNVSNVDPNLVVNVIEVSSGVFEGTFDFVLTP